MRFAAVGLIALALFQDPPVRVAGTIRIDGSPDPIPDVAIEVAFPNLRFKEPLYVTFPRDGSDRLFVVERDGRVHVFDNRKDVRGADLSLDITAKVLRSHDEEGLLGMAFHPKFKENGHVFLMYSAPRPRRNVLSRFTMDAARRRIRVETERVLMEIRQPYPNHNGGMIEFGPDNYLYVSLGDGGAADDPHDYGQSKATWLAKILRIDVDRAEGAKAYAIPPDNPFVKEKGALPEIWAYGLRNVWRFSFDRAGGMLIGGDVGQNAWEEVDIIKRGGNYGWNAREGAHDFRRGRGTPPFEEPILDYSHREGRSITGGYVYRGKRVPSLQGAYVYADYDTAAVWALRWDGKKVVENKLLGRQRNISSFGEDRDGEVYMTSFDGRIYQFVPRTGGEAAAKFPMKLSDTGLFPGGKPHASLLPYTVAVALWSDNGDKERWVMVPGDEKIGFAAAGAFAFPKGTIFVKQFSLDKRRLETRLLIHGADGWAGYTYVWNDEQTDAFLLSGSADKVFAKQTWSFPSRGDCISCHTAAAGHVLGFRARQLGPQLDRMGAWFDKPAKIDAWSARDARAYLEVNCANCHQPGGGSTSPIDLRASVAEADMKVLNAEPAHGDAGVKGAKVVTPGSPERSTLYLKMKDTSPSGMPPMAHNVVDDEGLRLVAEWIRKLR